MLTGLPLPENGNPLAGTVSESASKASAKAMKSNEK
jgi:hypothetical protein